MRRIYDIARVLLRLEDQLESPASIDAGILLFFIEVPTVRFLLSAVDSTYA
jgi:hypothetical protein